jgi:hypothetical protein
MTGTLASNLSKYYSLTDHLPFTNMIVPDSDSKEEAQEGPIEDSTPSMDHNTPISPISSIPNTTTQHGVLLVLTDKLVHDPRLSKHNLAINKSYGFLVCMDSKCQVGICPSGYPKHRKRAHNGSGPRPLGTLLRAVVEDNNVDWDGELPNFPVPYGGLPLHGLRTEKRTPMQYLQMVLSY